LRQQTKLKAHHVDLGKTQITLFNLKSPILGKEKWRINTKRSD